MYETPVKLSSQEYIIKQIPLYSDVCSNFPSLLTINLVNYYLSGVCLYSCNTASNFLLFILFFLKTMFHLPVFRLSSLMTKLHNFFKIRSESIINDYYAIMFVNNNLIYCWWYFDLTLSYLIIFRIYLAIFINLIWPF